MDNDRRVRRSDRHKQDGVAAQPTSTTLSRDDFAFKKTETRPLPGTIPSDLFGEIDALSLEPAKGGLIKACIRCKKKGVLIKLDSYGLCESCHKQVFEANLKALHALRKTITPEQTQAAALYKVIDERLEMLSSIQGKVDAAEQAVSSAESRVEDLKKELIVTEDEIEMETFALYRPKYNFTKAEEYKVRLDSVRADQKSLVKKGMAISGQFDWTVNNSKAEGKKLVNDMIKLCLRSFNNECEAAVAAVKFSNFDRCKARIVKASETIEKLGRIMKLSVTSAYLKSKIDELHIAYEYQVKKEEEKEEARALREQLREEAKLQKEIEEARKAAAKEQKHYEIALSNIEQQLASAVSAEERQALLDRREEIIQGINAVVAKLEDIDYRQKNQRAGYVYIISNIGSFGEGVYKIGMTRRLEPMERIVELSDASVPFNFDVHAMIFSHDAPQLEASLHRAFEHGRLNLVNRRREYFRVSLDDIKKVIHENHDKTVEYVDVPDAEQFRESLLMGK